MTDKLWLRFCIVVLRCLAKLMLAAFPSMGAQMLETVMANKLADELLENKKGEW